MNHNFLKGKPPLLVGGVIILVLALHFLGITKLLTKQGDNNTHTSVEVTNWKTYTDEETGFSIKYPSEYIVESSPSPTDFEWGSRSLLVIADNQDSASTKPRAVPVTVMLQRQPVTAEGTIYHTITEYQQSGTAAKMGQNVPNPDGELVTVNGMQALNYHYPAAESTDIASDTYIFIKDDLIYEVGFTSSEPHKKQMLESITWESKL